MKKRNTIIGVCSTATVVAVSACILAFGNVGNKDIKEQQTEQTPVVEEAAEEETAVALGITDISSVGASSIIDTMDISEDSLGQATGNVNYFNVGFAATVDSYFKFVGDADTSAEDKKEAIKEMDIATNVIPKGSIIEGYTNLGISNASTYLNVRKEAGTSYKIIGKMPGYSVCEVLEKSGDWYKIKSGNVTGYVAAEYILTGYDANVKAKEKMTEMLVVNCDKLNVREEASTDCSIATKVSKGEHLEVVEAEKDGWYKANINGLSGYVAAEYVDVVYTLPTAIEIKEVVAAPSSGKKPNGGGGTYSNLDPTVSQTAINLINTAYQYLGNPYRYGGNSLTNGIDCSGFVKQIFAKYGYNLPRTSSGYVSVGTPVPMSQIKAGDILIYKYGSRVGHVAIYIGNGKIIHAGNERSGICVGNYDFVYPYKAVRVIP